MLLQTLHPVLLKHKSIFSLKIAENANVKRDRPALSKCTFISILFFIHRFFLPALSPSTYIGSVFVFQESGHLCLVLILMLRCGFFLFWILLCVTNHIRFFLFKTADFHLRNSPVPLFTLVPVCFRLLSMLHACTD